MIDYEVLLKLLGAGALALPIALDRERKQRTAGLRTFPLVAITSCGFLAIGYRFLADGDQIANARLMQGLIGGLGFLGGGAILKNGGSIQGMATAASIWSAGAIGMAAAYSQWEVGIALSFVNFLTLAVGSKVKDAVNHNGDDEDPRPNCD